MALTTEQLLDEFANMSVLQLAEFKKAFETKFDVTAAAPMMMGAMPAGVICCKRLTRLRLVK